MTDNLPRWDGRFETTRWSVVLLAGGKTSPASTAALETLCRAYWEPVCAFARRRGRGEEDAKDLTQEFFTRLIQRRDFTGLDPGKGKFRTFLLAAFTNFLANDYARASAQKRGGGQAPVSLDAFPAGELDAVAPVQQATPGEAYDLVWAQTILRTALRKLKEEMAGGEKEHHFAQLARFLTLEAPPGAYNEVATRLGVAAVSVPVLVHRLRQRYRALVRLEVAQTVSTPVELEEEMRHLFAMLNR